MHHEEQIVPHVVLIVDMRLEATSLTFKVMVAQAGTSNIETTGEEKPADKALCADGLNGLILLITQLTTSVWYQRRITLPERRYR